MPARAGNLYAMAQRGKAKEAYRAAVAADPASVGGQIGLGRTLAAADPAQAETMFLASREKLGAASPYLVVPLPNVGTLIVESGLPAALLGPFRGLGLDIVEA